MSKRSKKTLLSDQFRQPYRKQRTYSLSRKLILVACSIILIFSALAYGCYIFATPVKAFYDSMRFPAWPEISWAQNNMVRIPEKLLTRNSPRIIRDRQPSDARLAKLYLMSDCMSPSLKNQRVIPFLRKNHYGFSESTIVLNNQSCQTLMIGPLHDYVSYTRIQSFLKHIQQNHSTTIRR